MTAPFITLPNTPVRVWLDDLRPMPPRFNLHVHSAEEAEAVLSSGRVVEISLDHDLGTEATGYDVACAIERGAYFGTIPRLTWAVHSANTVGRQRMEEALRRADSYWTSNEHSARSGTPRGLN